MSLSPSLSPALSCPYHIPISLAVTITLRSPLTHITITLMSPSRSCRCHTHVTITLMLPSRSCCHHAHVAITLMSLSPSPDSSPSHHPHLIPLPPVRPLTPRFTLASPRPRVQDTNGTGAFSYSHPRHHQCAVHGWHPHRSV